MTDERFLECFDERIVDLDIEISRLRRATLQIAILLWPAVIAGGVIGFVIGFVCGRNS